jgi:hypothetical protein
VPVDHFDPFHKLPGQVLAFLQVQKLIFGKYGSYQQRCVADAGCRAERFLLLVLVYQGCPTACFGIDAARFYGYLLV